VARAVPSEDWPRTVGEFEAWHARQPERWEFIDGVGDLWRERFLDAGIVDLDDPPVRLATDDLYAATDIAA
jgi:hypothetical protein